MYGKCYPVAKLHYPTITWNHLFPKTMNDQPRRRRGGSRNVKKAARQRPQLREAAFIERKIPYYELLDEAGLALIETNADLVLEEIGIDFRDDPEALTLLREAGRGRTR